MTSWAGSAVSKIAEWVVTSVVTGLVNTAYNSYLCDRRMSDDSEAELKRLSTALPKIRAVMGIAEALKMRDPNTGLWVGQFRQAVEESQLVLNELDYLNRDEAGESASSLKKRKRYIINDDTMKRLKDAVAMMDRATTEIDQLLQLATVLGVHGPAESRQDDTMKILKDCMQILKDIIKMLEQLIAKENNLIRLKTVLAFHGRSESQQEAGEVLRLEKQVFVWEVEKHKIIDCLKRPIDACLSSFGIASVGGIGKTTLVERVYQNMDSSIDFGNEIWVCVSTYFSFEGTTTKILVKLDEKNWSRKPLDVLEEAWKEKIHLKKLINRGEFRIFVREEKDIGFKLRIQDNVQGRN